jgi:hypothetical protein
MLLLIAGQKNKRDTARPQDCRDRKAGGIVEVYVQYGAIHGCFSSHATRLVQVADRANGLQAETAQIGGNFFRKQITVLDDEYFPRWHELTPPRLFCVRKRLPAIVSLAFSSGLTPPLVWKPNRAVAPDYRRILGGDAGRNGSLRAPLASRSQTP